MYISCARYSRLSDTFGDWKIFWACLFFTCRDSSQVLAILQLLYSPRRQWHKELPRYGIHVPKNEAKNDSTSQGSASKSFVLVNYEITPQKHPKPGTRKWGPKKRKRRWKASVSDSIWICPGKWLECLFQRNPMSVWLVINRSVCSTRRLQANCFKTM